MTQSKFVIVSDSGESWTLNGDDSKSDNNDALPKLLSDGWRPADQSMVPGSGSKDDTSYWMVLLIK